MYQINITEAAENDLRNAAYYIAGELNNKKAAKRLVDTVTAKLETLSDTPERHALVKDTFLAENGIRMLIVKNYLVFYIIREGTNSVSIIRIIHSRRDWETILKSDLRIKE